MSGLGCNRFMELPQIGSSRYKTEIVTLDGESIVLKRAESPTSYKALKDDVLKQVTSHIYYDKFRTPRLLLEDPVTYTFGHEYIPYIAACDYLCSTAPKKCSWFYRRVAEYLTHIFSIAEKAPFDYLSFNERVCKVAQQSVMNLTMTQVKDGKTRISAVTRLLLEMSDSLVGKIDYHGWCHGNLTLSNILINPTGTDVAWMGFRSDWDHSPYIDLAKLAQETRYLWSMRFRHDGARRPDGWYTSIV